MDLLRNLDQAVEFHGHICPFVGVGTVISNFALHKLESERSRDEELVCIAENDSCAIDAVQAVAGCTSGKGNLIIKGYGKHVYTFGLRSTGKALRVYFSPEVFDGLGFDDMVEKASALSERDLSYRWVEMDFPSHAEVAPSARCESCGEYAKSTGTVVKDGKRLCLPCSEKA